MRNNDEPADGAALRRRIEELSRVQRIGRIGGFEIDLRGGQFANHRSPEYLNVYGLASDAVSEAHEAWVQRIHPDDRERAESHFKDCVAGDARHYSSEYRIVLPDQGVRWISAVAEIDRDEQGAPLRMLGVHIDITRTKEAEAALRASELALKESQQRLREFNEELERLAEERARQLATSRALLQAFFDNSPDWLTLQRCKPDGGFLYEDINPTCEIAYGLSRSLVIGRRVEDILGEEGAKLPLANFRECVRTGQPQRYVTHRTMAGVTRFIDVVSVLVPGARDGADRFLLTTARDLTEREQMEARIRQSQRMDAIGQLTGGVAHDFNNLLTIIMGSATLLRRGTSKDSARLIDSILLAGERGGALTRQLLSLARNRPINRQVVDLTVHVPRLTGMLRSSLRGDIELQASVDPATGLVEVDPGELEIALLNIALNARDAMPNGGSFAIDIGNLDLAEPPPSLPASPNGFVAIALRDTGTGMTADVIGRAFEPFFTTKQPGAGTGLGLSQVFGFARGSGGVVNIESTPGMGTEIRITLPITQKPLESQPVVIDERVQSLKGRVLLVDDNLAVLGVIANMIAAMGLDVDHADSAIVALEHLTFQPERFDVVLTDVVMPGMNGVDLAREITTIYPTMPVVLMSGYNDVPITAEFQMLHKPVSYEQLYDVLRRHLSAESAGDD